MSGSRRSPDWFERHDAEIRELAWLGAVAGAPHPTTLAVDEGAPEDEPEVVPVAALVTEREAALAAAEARVAESTAALEQLRSELAASRAETEVLRGEVAAARRATVELAARMRDDAESELVKLAMAVAERVVGRELTVAPELIVEWARDAVAGSDLGGSFVVATSAELSAAVPDAAWGELEDALRMDPSLPAGTAEVRADGRTVTVSAEERLESVADALTNVTGTKAA